MFSPSHPYVHGFEGDTLIFYADSASVKSDEAYLGPVRGWRPGMAAAQALTGGRGVVCVGHLRSDGVLCIENQERRRRRAAVRPGGRLADGQRRRDRCPPSSGCGRTTPGAR